MRTLRRCLSIPLLLLAALAARPALAAQPFTAFHEGFYPPGLTGSPGQEAWFGRAADLDGDGRDELITGRWDLGNGSSVVTVRRFGSGLWDPGTVTSHVVGWSGWTPGRCEVADLDDDGLLDIAVPVYDTLAILPGTAPLAFGAPVHVPVPGITSVAIGDFDEDGIRDFAVTRNSANEVQIWRGTGAFAFTLDSQHATHNGTEPISVADLDGNTAPDLVVGDASVSIAFVGDGAGGFTLIDIGAAGAQPCGDLNGDGKEDLLAATSTLLGNGDGTFSAPIPYLPALTVALAADLDEDGRPDLIGRRTLAPTPLLSVQRGLGNGQFGVPDYPAWWPSQPFAFETGDFDGDGHVDLAMPGRNVEPDAIFHGLGNGTFLAPRQIALTSPPRHVAAGSLGGTSQPDLVVTSRAANSMSVLLSTGLGSWAPADTVILPGTPGGRRIAVADLNADGRDDIVIGYSNLASVSYWLTQPDGLPGARTDLTTPAVGTADLQVADLDNDLVPDILWLVPSGSVPLQWFRGLGGGSFGIAQALSVNPTQCFTAGDLSGDGIVDIAFAPTNHTVTVAIASTPGVFPSPVTHSWSSSEPPLTVPYQQIVSGDFDGDPYPDLALQGTVGLIRLHGLGSGAFASPAGIGSAAAGANTYCPPGDLDGDGVEDLVSGGPVSSRLRVLKFAPGGSLAVNPILGISTPTTSGGTTLALADVDGNGTLDILSTLARRPWLDLLLNRTPPEVLAVPPPAVGGGGLALAALRDPAHGTLSFRLTTTLGASVRVELVDLQGRRIRSTIVRPNPGSATTVNLGDASAIPAGLYFARARQGAHEAKTKLSVVH